MDETEKVMKGLEKKMHDTSPITVTHVVNGVERPLLDLIPEMTVGEAFRLTDMYVAGVEGAVAPLFQRKWWCTQEIMDVMALLPGDTCIVRGTITGNVRVIPLHQLEPEEE